MVEISSTALAEIDRLKRTRKMPDSFLRLSVKSGGCSGLFYNLELENISENLRHQQSDRTIEIQGIQVIVDPQSWQYIEHLQLDYSEDLMGGGFRFHNSQVKQTCGCGISFAEVEPEK